MNIGDQFGGGTIFYILPDGLSGLVVANYDLLDKTVWGSTRLVNVGTSGMLGDGRLDTDKLVAEFGTNALAANACKELALNGFSDWYLPTVGDLDLLHETLLTAKVFNPQYINDCWSSTQDSYGNPFKESIYSGQSYALSQGNKANVRPVRTFNINDAVVPIKPCYPIFVTASNTDLDDFLPFGLTSAMEFSLDGSDYQQYSPLLLDRQMIKGDHVLKIRTIATGIHPASDDVIITYTADTVDPTTPVDPIGGDGLKDIAFTLRSAYIQRLAGLNYNSISVPVYDDFVPDEGPDYFVVIKDITEADESLKGMFNTHAHVTLDIVTRFTGGNGSSMVRDAISNQINGLICPALPSKRLDLRPDFNLMNSIRTMSRPILEQTKTYNILRKVNIYKHEIQQLS